MQSVAQFIGKAITKLVDALDGPREPMGDTAPSRIMDPIPLAVGDANRERRIQGEILMIAPHFGRHGEIQWDETNGNWLMITRYPMPARWSTRWAQLLIRFPETYPATPPLGFYLDQPHLLRDGRNDHHLTGRAHYTAPDLQALGWSWYCVNVSSGPGGWRPSADWREPDNLWSFMHLIRDSLTNEE